MEDSVVKVGVRDIPEIMEALSGRCSVYDCDPLLTVVGLAVELCSDITAVRKIKHDLDNGRITTDDALTETLKEWMDGYAKQGSGAPLEEFLEVMILSGLSCWADKILRLLLKLSRQAVEKKVELETVHQDELTANASIAIANRAQERAVENTLILEEIFKNLPFEDRKNFKLVNQVWGELGLRLWRRSARIRIGHHMMNGRRGGWIDNMQTFVELCQQKMELDQSTKDKTLELLAYPYRSYSITNIRSPGGEIQENEFWKTCGPLIESLKLPSFHQNNNEEIVKAVMKLLLALCPNLKELEIKCFPQRGDSDSVSETTIDKSEEFSGKMAEKLETLILDYLYYSMSAAQTSKIFKICPNLKSFVGTGRQIEGLLQPATNGKFIQVETLVIRECDVYYEEEDVYNDDAYRSCQSLRSYVEKFPDTLKHLKIQRLNDMDIRSNPSHLCAALDKCSHNLQSLELEFEERILIDEFDWFMDLSRISFPNLTKFRFEHHEYHDYYDYPFRFDFGTLKVMPKLKELDVNVSYKDPIKFPRSPGTEDWIYVAPPGGEDQLAPAAAGSEKKLILSTTLKKFRFDGWEINAEDVKLLSQWFPNLTSLDARLSTESLSLLLESWERLANLQVRSKGLVPLSKLRLLKETKNSLKIVAHLMEKFRGWSHCIEVKELNGHVYFDKCS